MSDLCVIVKDKYHRPKISLDFVLENNEASSSSSRNPYIQHFSEQIWINSIKSLSVTNYAVKQLLNHRSLKKEITEIYGALVLMEKAARCYYNIGDSSNLLSFECLQSLNKNEQLVFYDICSGKGIASFILSFMFPNSKIHMVDFNKSLKLGHLNEIKNVQFKYIDLYSSEFETYLLETSSIYLQNKSMVFCFGLHLCGNLSIRLTNIYNVHSSIYCLVLSPCCMPKSRNPKKDKKNGLKSIPLLRNSAFFNYENWCLNVYFNIQKKLISKNIYNHDDFVLSDKSTYIYAYRIVS